MSSTTAGLTFLSWYRRGLAAGIDAVPGGLDAELHPQAKLHIDVSVNNASAAIFDATLHSPGDVAGFDVNHVIRTDPAPGATNVETKYLPLIEFTRADLPWMLTPNVPQRGKTTDTDPRRGLLPWLVLVVIPSDSATITPTDGSGKGSALPILATTLDQLPDLSESWLWAHAQVLTIEGDTVDSVIQAEPHRALSRLIAPRRLRANTAYFACVVPAFDAGRDAGLGQTPISATLGPAWQAGQADPNVRLPVYYSWKFWTGPAGTDFLSLARLLKGYDSSGAGTRRLDVGQAGLGKPNAGDPAWELDFEGVLVGANVVIGKWDPSVPEDAFKKALATRLDGGPNELAPTVYGSSQAEFHGSLTAGDGAAWLRTLNLDPRYRVVAALGTEVVQRYQEALMASAWEQAAELRKANQLLARGQLAREASSRIYQKRIAANSATDPLADDRLMQLTAAIHSQVSAPAGTAGGSVATVVAQNSSLQSAVTTPFRRITRPRGPLAKRTLATPLPSPVHPIANGSVKVTPLLKPVSGQVSFEAISGGTESIAIKALRVATPLFPWETQPAPVLAIPYGFMSDLLIMLGSGDAVPVVTSWAGRAADFMGVPQLGWSQVSSVLGFGFSTTTVSPTMPTYVDFAGRNGVITFNVSYINVSPDRGFLQAWYDWYPGYPLDGTLQRSGGGIIIPAGTPTEGILGAIAVAATDLTGHGNIDVVCVWSLAVGTVYHTRIIVGRGLDASGTMTGGWTGVQNIGPNNGSLSVAAMGRQLCILSGKELRVVTLDDAGTFVTSAVSDAFSAQLPPDFVTGSIATAAFGAVGMDLVFCYSAGIGDQLHAGYRLALDIRPDGAVGGWGEQSPLPFPGAPLMQLLLGVMTHASEALRTKQTTAFRAAAAATQTRQERVFEAAIAPPAPPNVPITALAQQLRSAIDPKATFPSNVLGRLPLLSAMDPNVVSDALQTAVCSPYFPQPMYETFRDLHFDRFMPGGSAMPDNRAALLEANGKVIEAYLVGLSAELARSLLWHGFPGSLQATYFDRFWDGRDAAGSPLSDITAINGWPLATDLGGHAQGATNPLVLLVRGELLRRVQHVTIYAAPANGSRTLDVTSDGHVTGRIDPLFTGRLNPDIAFFGFDLGAGVGVPQVRGDGGTPGWYFVFQEHPTAPRFGLNEPPLDTSTYGYNGSKPAYWRELDWSEVVSSKTEYDALTYIACSKSPLAKLTLTDNKPTGNGTGQKQHRFGFSAAHMAHIMFEPAVQVGIHGSLLLPRRGG